LVAESISDAKFETESITNKPTAHAQILSSEKSPKMVSRARNDLIFVSLNSNMTSDFKPEVVVWLKLHMRSEKLPK